MNMKMSSMMKIGNRTLALACAVFAVEAQEAPFVTRPEETDAARFEPYLEYVLEDSMLSFAAISDSRGKALGSLAIEIGPSDRPGKLAILGNSFRTPTDLAGALTKVSRGGSQWPGTFPEGTGATDCEASWPGFRNEVLS